MTAGATNPPRPLDLAALRSAAGEALRAARHGEHSPAPLESEDTQQLRSLIEVFYNPFSPRRVTVEAAGALVRAQALLGAPRESFEDAAEVLLALVEGPVERQELSDLIELLQAILDPQAVAGD